MAQGTLVIRAIAQGSSLAVRTTAAADLERAAYEMTMRVQGTGTICSRPDC
jgi:hypothetical protein